jgi:hypothetical protein
MVGLNTQNDLETALRQNKWLGEILERFEEVALPDSWLAAGCIAQTIWNLGCGQRAEFGLKDVDLIYFDEQDLSMEIKRRPCEPVAHRRGTPNASARFERHQHCTGHRRDVGAKLDSADVSDANLTAAPRSRN